MPTNTFSPHCTSKHQPVSRAIWGHPNQMRRQPQPGSRLSHLKFNESPSTASQLVAFYLPRTS